MNAIRRIKYIYCDKWFLGIMLGAILLRIIDIGTIPPSNLNNPILGRLPTVIASIGSLFLSYTLSFEIANRFLNNHFKPISVARWALFWLGFMPVHLVESRVVSRPMIALVVILFWILTVFLQRKHWIWWIVTVIPTIVGVYFVYPSLWIFQGQSINISNILSNVFHLFSFTLFFFRNDTFWWGGMRIIGLMLPVAIIPFLVGLYISASYMQKRAISWSIFFITMLTVAVIFNPIFPESRIVVWFSPIFAYILGIGTEFLITKHKKKSIKSNAVFIIATLMLVYQLVIFWRLYTVQYATNIRGVIHSVEVPF